MDDDNGDIAPLFRAVLSETSGTPVVRLLNTVLVGEKPTSACLFQIDSEKIKVTIETNRVMQGTATLPRALFFPYTLHSTEPSVELKVNLKSLLNSINLYTDCPADDHKVLLSEPEVPFTLGFKLIEEATKLIITIIAKGLATECEVTTLATTLDFPLLPSIRETDFICKLTIDASVLNELWLMFDHTCEKISIKVEKKSFCFMMEGQFGSTCLEMNKNHSSHNSYVCNVPSPVTWTYRASLLKRAIRPVCIAAHTAAVHLKCSSEGFLSIQYELDVSDQGPAFIEYVYRPIAEDSAADGDISSGV